MTTTAGAAPRLPAPPNTEDARIISSTDGLMPEFRSALYEALARMWMQGFDPIIYETVRTDARQRWLYGFGREYDDGRGRVTNAKTADSSYHAFGLAADIISKADAWDAETDFWSALGQAVRMVGLTWGGDWRRFRDLPHVQYPRRTAPSETAKRLLREGNLAAVWEMARGTP